jgi:hypothetical protein
MSGALFSSIVAGDSVIKAALAWVLLILIGVLWYFRPADRKLFQFINKGLT